MPLPEKENPEKRWISLFRAFLFCFEFILQAVTGEKFQRSAIIS